MFRESRRGSFYEWPKDRGVLDSATTIMFTGDTFPLQRMADPTATLKELGEMMKRGVGWFAFFTPRDARAAEQGKT
jgi:hypothetical protein